jgi:hypothetical protein
VNRSNFRFRSLKKWSAELGGGVSVSTLRREFLAGRIKGIRARPSCNAPILISEQEMERWIEEVASRRRNVPSPADVAKDNAEGGSNAS